MTQCDVGRVPLSVCSLTSQRGAASERDVNNEFNGINYPVISRENITEVVMEISVSEKSRLPHSARRARGARNEG